MWRFKVIHLLLKIFSKVNSPKRDGILVVQEVNGIVFYQKTDKLPVKKICTKGKDS
jgi:hypothetical protein